MDWFFKKMGPAAAMSLVAFTGVLNAADDASMRNLENRVTALEQKRGANGMINPPARPVIREGADVFFSAELLIWKPREDDLNYATELSSGIPTADNTFRDAKVQNWKGKWNAGVRLGLGWNTSYDGWDLSLFWTHFNSRNKKSHDGNDCDCCPCAPGVFQPEYFPKDYCGGGNLTPIYVTEAENKRWKLRLNMLDLELGREFFVSKWMTLRPHVGVRGAWIRQKFKVEYEGGNMFSSAASNCTTCACFVTDAGSFAAGTVTEDEISMKNNFWGVGLRAGLDSQWGLGAGFSLFGKLALSALWGKFKVNQVHELENTAGVEGRIMVMKNNFNVCRPIMDLALGLRYDTTFSNDSWGFGVWAGWEHHYFWGQNKLFKMVGANYDVVDQNDGDLSVAGVNIGVSFDF